MNRNSGMFIKLHHIYYNIQHNIIQYFPSPHYIMIEPVLNFYLH